MLELAPRGEDSGPKKHAFLKRSGTRPRKNINPKLEKLPQNNGLVGFNKGMTYAEKKGEKSKVNLSKKSFKVPPGGHSSLDLFSQTTTDIPDPRELRKQNQIRPLSQEQPRATHNQYSSNINPSRKYQNDQQSSGYSTKNYQNDQQSSGYSNRNYQNDQQSSGYSNRNYQNDQQSSGFSNRNHQNDQQSSGFSNINYQNDQQSSGFSNINYQNDQQSSGYSNRNYQNGQQCSKGNYQHHQQSSSRSNIFQQEVDVPLYGARSNNLSSNHFACGSNQNCGNVITERSSTRLHAPPGGVSSFSLAHDESRDQSRRAERNFVPPQEHGNKAQSRKMGEENDSTATSAVTGSIGLLLKKGNKLIREFGDIENTGRKESNVPVNSRVSRAAPQPISSRRASQGANNTNHNPVKVPGLENHYSDRQKKQFAVFK